MPGLKFAKKKEIAMNPEKRKTRPCLGAPWAVGVLVSLLSLSGFAYAQSDSGRIRGTISDAQGKILVGATVTLTSTATGRSRSATTNSDGAYAFDLVEPGHYKIEASKPGFAPAQGELTVDLSQAQQVDLHLNVAAATAISLPPDASRADT